MSRVRRFLGIAFLSAGSVALYGSAAQAQTVANGDFETNASLFTAFPGYVGGSNPAQVTGFSGPAGGYGLNPGNGGAGTPFRDNGNDSTNVLFIQGGDVTLTQAVSGFTPGQAYQLSFIYNVRAANNQTAGILVSIGGGSFTDDGPLNTGIVPVGGANPYYNGLVSFTAGLSGTETLSINKFDAAAGDSTALFDNFTITAVPEPASLGLLGLGGLALIRRRRA